MSLKSLIEEMEKRGRIRHAPFGLDWTKDELNLEFRESWGYGIEFVYIPATNSVEQAWRTLDGQYISEEQLIEKMRAAL